MPTWNDAAATRNPAVLIGQVLDKKIPAQRLVLQKPKNDLGYYVLKESEIDRYVPRRSAAVNWSPPEEGSVDYSRDLEGDLSDVLDQAKTPTLVAPLHLLQRNRRLRFLSSRF